MPESLHLAESLHVALRVHRKGGTAVVVQYAERGYVTRAVRNVDHVLKGHAPALAGNRGIHVDGIGILVAPLVYLEQVAGLARVVERAGDLRNLAGRNQAEFCGRRSRFQVPRCIQKTGLQRVLDKLATKNALHVGRDGTPANRLRKPGTDNVMFQPDIERLVLRVFFHKLLDFAKELREPRVKHEFLAELAQQLVRKPLE